MRRRTQRTALAALAVLAIAASGARAADDVDVAAAVSTNAAAETAPPEAELDYDPLLDAELEEELDLAADPDPLEGMNRAFFTFNGWLDSGFWEPVTNAYRFAVPEPGRLAVRRFFLNLSSAPTFVNDLLQLRFDDAGRTLGRFCLNSTVGMAGLFDAGVEAGWAFHDSDFGETLGLYGVPPGPYLVIPIFGPSTVRDGFGDVVDRLFEPLTYIFGIGLIGSSIQVAVGTGTGITTYEAHYDQLDELEKAAIDYYSAMRSVYLQNREAQVQEVIDDSWWQSEREAPQVQAAN